MPPRKEPKETVVYPASKRKPPPFKPLQPSKVPRNTSATARSSTAKPQSFSKQPTAKGRKQDTLPDSEEDEEDSDADEAEQPSRSRIGRSGDNDSSSGEELADIPPPSKFATASGKAISNRSFKPPLAKRANPRREPSPMLIDSENSSPPPLPGDSSPPAAEAAGEAHRSSPSDTVPAIPQPLLVRLLHEGFQDKSTDIDKHAIQVVQKYLEIYVREAIARTAQTKREEAEKGEISELDGRWLELEDLEKVAPGLMMDF